jgi:hypothetical protein
MPRDDSHTPRDLVEKLDGLRVKCNKCGRSGRYRVLRLAEQIGWDGKLTDWLYSLAKDYPRKRSPGPSDPFGARCPDLPISFEEFEEVAPLSPKTWPHVRRGGKCAPMLEATPFRRSSLYDIAHVKG